LVSFELCLQHGCDGFEFDVRRSADGVAVICHDPCINGLEIENTPANALPVPTLEQVLRQFAHRAFLDIELKVAGLETILIAALQASPPQKGYAVSSFLPEVLKTVHDLDGSVPLGFLSEPGGDFSPDSPTGTLLASFNNSVAWMIPRIDLVDQVAVERFRRDGKRIMVWTVNSAEEMRCLAGWGIDAIISDDTDLLVRSFR
jgi:glycerophosphoryl diester phosphodiesterase